MRIEDGPAFELPVPDHLQHVDRVVERPYGADVVARVDMALGDGLQRGRQVAGLAAADPDEYSPAPVPPMLNGVRVAA